jgi:RNA polymerase sigma-70 factor (ECF subfamily)
MMSSSVIGDLFANLNLSHRTIGGAKTPQMTDRELVDRVRAGDQDAFEQLFRAHYDELTAFARRYAHDASGAEELVQSLFADLWAERARWEIRSSVRAYLFTAVRNRGLNARRRGLIERDWDDADGRSDTEALQWSPPAPDVELEHRETTARVVRALGSLPERCRLVMQLRWRDQLSYAEIAEAMGISVKGVEIQLSRGLKALREKLL